MSRKKLKLFLWEDVLTDYTPGVMGAYAYSPDHARELLLAQCSYLPKGDLAKEPKVIETEDAFICWGGG